MRKLLAAAVLTIAVVGATSQAGAGGWAVVSLDPLASAPAPGRPFDVGFMLRQHGQTPVNDPDAAIVVVGPDGARTRFPAHHAGATGHHVATVTLAAAGTYDWSVEHFLGTQDLGTISTGSATASDGGGSERSPWTAPLLAIAALLAGLGIVDLVRSRRPQPA